VKVKLAVFFALIFILYAAYGLVVSDSLFDSSWLLAIATIPTSSVMNVLLQGVKNIYLNISFLIVGGIVQYAVLGFLTGLVLDQVKNNE